MTRNQDEPYNLLMADKYFSEKKTLIALRSRLRDQEEATYLPSISCAKSEQEVLSLTFSDEEQNLNEILQ